MGKYESPKPAKAVGQKKKWIIVIFMAIVVVALALVAMFLGGKGTSAQETLPTEQEQVSNATEAVIQTVPATEATVPTRKELTIDSVEQQNDMMVLKTSYGTVKYSFAFSDLIEIVATNQDTQAALEWFVLVGEEKYPLFTISFNGSEGELLGTMVVEADKPAEQVRMLFFAADGNLEDAELQTFYAAQEVLNNVIASLTDNETFTVAE